MLNRIRKFFTKTTTTSSAVVVPHHHTVQVQHPHTLKASAALYLAASKNDSDTVRILASSANVNAHAHDNGETALHAAARRGSDEAIQALLGCHKLNPNEVDADGRTALHTAILYNRETSVELLKNSVDQTIADKHGRTPRDLAFDMMLDHLLEDESETTSLDEESLSFSESCSAEVSEESSLQFDMEPCASAHY